MTANQARPARRLDTLRRADWLNAERARGYSWVFLTPMIFAVLAWVVLARGGMDPTGKALGTDFTSFWTASRLALGGAPQAAYNVPAHHAQQVAIFHRDTGYSAFFYPPIFLLVCLPLATLPYLASLAAWLAGTGALYWRMARAWLGRSFGTVPIVAYPAVLINMGNGQNGFLSAALFGAGALWLGRRPIAAGLCLGALAYKPHLGLIIPIALAIEGRWKTFATATATVAALAALSLALFGPATWIGFLADSALARTTLENGLVGYARIDGAFVQTTGSFAAMQSAFAAVRLWGGPTPVAYGVQAAVAALAVAGLLWLRRQRPGSDAAGPAMIVAALLATPFLLDYDLVILAAPLAWMLREGARRGFLSWEKTVLAAAFVLPLISRTLATAAKVPLAPFVMAALFVAVLRRAVVSDRLLEAPRP